MPTASRCSGRLYDDRDAEDARGAVAASSGCGVPTAVADLKPGWDSPRPGSAAGADVLISARRVAPGGRPIGLDMTDEMLELARSNAQEAGAINARFITSYLEAMPLPRESVDVVISSCVISLSGENTGTIAEAVRVLRPAAGLRLRGDRRPRHRRANQSRRGRLNRLQRRSPHRRRIPRHPHRRRA